MKLWFHGPDQRVFRDSRPAHDGAIPSNPYWTGGHGRLSLFAKNVGSGLAIVIEAGDVDLNVTGAGMPHGCELWVASYLQLTGCSLLAYDRYDQRHVPPLLRGPHDDKGRLTGTWKDRPGADQWIPDPLMPMRPVTIAARTSQTFWLEVTPECRFEAITVEFRINGTSVSVPVALDRQAEVHVRTRVHAFLEFARVCQWFGLPRAAHEGTDEEARAARALLEQIGDAAAKHALGLWRYWVPSQSLDKTAWPSLQNDAVCVGAYGDLWGWNVSSAQRREELKRLAIAATSEAGEMRGIVHVYDEARVLTPAEHGPLGYSLQQFDEAARRCREVKGTGLLSMVTTTLPEAWKYLADADIICFTPQVRDSHQHEQLIVQIRQRGQAVWAYNGGSPAIGTEVIEDPIGLRTIGLAQYQHDLPLWMLWSCCYWWNEHTGWGKNDVWRNPVTFGRDDSPDPILGRTGYQRQMGGGNLFYPDPDGKLAVVPSLRLKSLREGQIDRSLVAKAGGVDRYPMDPRGLFHGVDDPKDPTFRHCVRPWSESPWDWHSMRMAAAAKLRPDPLPEQPSPESELAAGLAEALRLAADALTKYSEAVEAE